MNAFLACHQCSHRIHVSAPACPKCGALANTTSSLPAKDAPTSLPDKWINLFALIEKAGGPKMPKFLELSSAERGKVIFNIWGFLFGPLYYLTKGMWKKTIVLLAISIIGVSATALLPESFGSILSIFITPVIFATRANIDYYKKMVLGENDWW